MKNKDISFYFNLAGIFALIWAVISPSFISITEVLLLFIIGVLYGMRGDMKNAK